MHDASNPDTPLDRPAGCLPHQLIAQPSTSHPVTTASPCRKPHSERSWRNHPFRRGAYHIEGGSARVIPDRRCHLQ